MSSENSVAQNTRGPAVNYYCNLKIKGKKIITANIVHLTIKEWIFDIVPRIELILNDDGTLSELFPLQDGDLIEVEMAKNDVDTPTIQMKFTLISYTSGSMKGNKFIQIAIVGAMQVTGFYSPIYTRSFSNQTSKDVLLHLLNTEGQITFNSEVDTVDTMTWLQIHKSNIEFCKHVLKRSYVANDTMFLYADSNGEFNYTSFNTEAAKNYVGTARFDLKQYSADAFQNNADYTDYWFNSFNVYDFNGYVNKIRNYGVSYTYYDTSSGRTVGTLSDSSHPLTQLTAKDINAAGQTTHEFDMGFLPPGNVFSQYYTALIQNDYRKFNLFSGFILELNINALGKPRLFSKVNVIVPSVLTTGENSPMTGNYMVAGVIHEVGKGIQYRKRMALMRNGFNRSQFMKIPTVQA